MKIPKIPHPQIPFSKTWGMPGCSYNGCPPHIPNWGDGPTFLQILYKVIDTLNGVIETLNGTHGLPAGGDTNQVLTKTSGEDYAVKWKDPQGAAGVGVPTGGTTGQVLAKKSNTDYDTEWTDVQGGGGTGDVTAAGDNTFTGSNTFNQPVNVAQATAPEQAVNLEQMQELEDKFDNDISEMGNSLNDLDANAVKVTGDQTVNGVKNFTDSPTGPNPTEDNQFATKNYVDTHSGGGGTESDLAWLPDVAEDGTITWTKSASETPPEPRNIKGPQGPEGPKGETGKQGPTGEQGPAGPQGPAGADGDTGPAGEDGKAATIRVGEVQTGESGSQASVTNVGNENAAVFNFIIPKGDKGDTGNTGPQGQPGEQGPAGEPGEAGVGVPSGGTTGQVLAKKSNSDYDTEWTDVQGGGTGDVTAAGNNNFTGTNNFDGPVRLKGSTTVSGSTIFSRSPTVPDPTLQTHAVNLKTLEEEIALIHQLPSVSTTDAGKVLQVNASGVWEANGQLPEDVSDLSDGLATANEEIQNIKNGALNTMASTGSVGQVWTKGAEDSGHWADAQGGGGGSFPTGAIGEILGYTEAGKNPEALDPTGSEFVELIQSYDIRRGAASLTMFSGSSYVETSGGITSGYMLVNKLTGICVIVVGFSVTCKNLTPNTNYKITSATFILPNPFTKRRFVILTHPTQNTWLTNGQSKHYTVELDSRSLPSVSSSLVIQVNPVSSYDQDTKQYEIIEAEQGFTYHTGANETQAEIPISLKAIAFNLN